MTHPAVQYVLDKIKANWSAGNYADIPLERIDRDNSEQLDDNIRAHTEELQSDNYVGASFANRENNPIGTEYDHDIGITVNVRIEGLHKSEYGKVDPSASLPPATANDPIPFAGPTALVGEIRDTILAERTFPDTGVADIDYTNLVVSNEAPLSYEYGDYYRHDMDIIFEGYEEL